MYYTFRDNRAAEFLAYMPSIDEAEIYAERNYLTIVERKNTLYV